ncbi:hypothetical protein RFI_28998 [Reticulomyxa filosa]|uniref:Uncharacterized protein n=1 Tax=Reticulomyxa filosa TaxID=46433 RepID=X6M392_RETFI|nr:hypothetical protein RFI_28998 [Reticulomyxa filosa]|eukprot:ETO08389.1 hypothetical protein RFI_28998 [Reticulomyxa filosa]
MFFFIPLVKKINLNNIVNVKLTFTLSFLNNIASHHCSFHCQFKSTKLFKYHFFQTNTYKILSWNINTLSSFMMVKKTKKTLFDKVLTFAVIIIAVQTLLTCCNSVYSVIIIWLCNCFIINFFTLRKSALNLRFFIITEHTHPKLPPLK